MSGTLLSCTVCGTSNVFPGAGVNVPQKNTTTAFCKTCGGVTLQRVADSNGREDRHSERVHVHKTSTTDTSELLWTRLQEALASSGVTMEEFLHCGASTQARLVSAVGFNGTEISKLMEIVKDHTPDKKNSNLMEPMQKPINATEEAAKATTRTETMASELSKKPETNTETETNRISAETLQKISQNEGVFVQTPSHSPQMDGSMLKLKVQEDGSLSARCSVYPHLPAEFWCSLCGILVSSRCHVSGIHKDHPFVTLRQAAEAHVRDLSTWSERCRSQLNVANTIVANLQHGKDILKDSVKREEDALDNYLEEIVRGLTEWSQTLKSSMHKQIDSQLNNIDVAINRTNMLVEYYAERLKSCDPLLQTIPSIQQVDKKSEDWSLRVMDLVTRLKTSNQEPIPMPRVTVPEVKSFANVTTYMELLKMLSVPSGIRIPDVLDTGYLNFPNPSALEREVFTLQVPKDAHERGLLIHSGRTLTRSQDIIPTHSLVCGSRIFFTGITAWKVHVDRIGTGPGRILAGVLMAGTDGEGVVWDGQRIVGPNEGECRVLPDKYKLQTGTTLRFVLELEAPSYFIVCYYEDEVVARVPLPPVLNGWVPAFSVFGPQDQVTVEPISTSVAEHLLSDANREESQKKEDEMHVRLSEQEQKLNALHQQVLAVNSRMVQDQYEKFVRTSSQPQQEMKKSERNGNGIAEPSLVSSTPFRSMPPQSPGNGYRYVNKNNTPENVQNTDTEAARVEVASPSILLTSNVTPGQRDPQNTGTASYSPELRNLLNFVESIK